MIQNEYRQENKDSSFIADFGFVNNFKSKKPSAKKYLFVSFGGDLEFSIILIFLPFKNSLFKS